MISWQDLPAAQQPDWPDRDALSAVLAELAEAPPLVVPAECDALTGRLASVARGEAFVLHGGDCAETFAGARADTVRAKISTILQMAVVLTYGAAVPVVKVGRMAGQFAKPRSRGDETRGEVTLPAYRGDAVNGFAFTAGDRTPDPRRLLRAYSASSATLNLIRAYTTGGFADLRRVHEWNRGYVRGSAAMQAYEAMARDIDRALRFMAACGAQPEQVHGVDFYASHEALLLDYEQALTRVEEGLAHPAATRSAATAHSGGTGADGGTAPAYAGPRYDCSAHFLWLGERTRQLDGAHVAFAATVRNPIGVKLGPRATADDALALVARLNPGGEPGRLTFITRMGAERVRDVLPELVGKVSASGAQVAWVCDPMHGNTVEAPSGHKTRRFEDVIDEVRGFFEVHRALGTWPGGISVELTGDDVTECLGGSLPVGLLDLATRYETVCDPRLNHQQSLELAFLVAEMLDR